MPNRATRRDFLTALGAGGAAALLPRTAEAQAGAASRPNFVFFLVDDMGWMDSTPYGSQYYETPNFERLAARAVRFTDAYAASPLCSPTRASIMSGQYPCRFGLTSATGHQPPEPDHAAIADKAGPSQKVIYPYSRHFMPTDRVTIAETLRDAGYHTGHFGKWHLGLTEEYWPEAQGFEVSFHGAPDPGPPSYFSPYGFAAGTVTDGPPGEYIADRLTDEAIAFIKQSQGRPFFCNLWHYSVHGPWGHKEEYTKHFVGKLDPRGEQGNPIMASMLKSADDSLGRLLDTLDQLKLNDNTVFILFSDNGGNIHSNISEDGRFMRIGERHPRWAFKQDWLKYAGDRPPTSNAPLRGGKATIFEGGTREPLMICWPGVTQPGTVNHEVTSSVDFYPTLLDIAGLKPPSGYALDGVSLTPLLRGGKLNREAIFCHFPHSFGKRSPAATYVRSGDWKLIRNEDPSDSFPEKFMLYNLRDDLGETTNLAAREPARMSALDALIDGFLARTGALVPKLNPAYLAPPPIVAGWRGMAETKLALSDGALQMTSTDKRTQMMTADVPPATGKLTLRAKVKPAAGNSGILYWQTDQTPYYVKERRADYTLQAGEWQELEVTFEPQGKLTGLRFDVVTLPTSCEVAWIRLGDASGKVLKEWAFGE